MTTTTMEEERERQKNTLELKSQNGSHLIEAICRFGEVLSTNKIWTRVKQTIDKYYPTGK